MQCISSSSTLCPKKTTLMLHTVTSVSFFWGTQCSSSIFVRHNENKSHYAPNVDIDA